MKIHVTDAEFRANGKWKKNPRSHLRNDLVGRQQRLDLNDRSLMDGTSSSHSGSVQRVIPSYNRTRRQAPQLREVSVVPACVTSKRDIYRHLSHVWCNLFQLMTFSGSLLWIGCRKSTTLCNRRDSGNHTILRVCRLQRGVPHGPVEVCAVVRELATSGFADGPVVGDG